LFLQRYHIDLAVRRKGRRRSMREGKKMHDHKTPRRRKLSAVALACFLGIGAAAYADPEIVPLTPTQQKLLQGTLERELAPLVAGIRAYEDQIQDFPLKVSVSADRRITLDLGAEAGPHAREELEDFHTSLYHQVMYHADKTGIGSTIDFRYGGKPVESFTPQGPMSGEEIKLDSSPGVTRSSAILISPSHGYYYHHTLLEWKTQRPERNGIIEDFLTPAYARELAFWISRRSGTETVIPRSYSDEVYEDSGHTWSTMGAKYHLKNLLPDNPEIWNSRASEANGLLDYRQDIKSRPLMANYLNVATAIHLHTNGSDQNPSANGTRAIYHTGRGTDEKLANSVLCSMGEIIHATENFESFNVAKIAEPRSNLAENSLAAMPSVLIEIGFHTNAGDAAALKDATFRTASMKGIEKGYRLFSEGKKCETFTLTKVVDDPTPMGNFIPVDAHYEGNPEFEATLVTEYVECPDDMQCWTAKIPFDKRPSPVRFFIDCGSSPTPREHRMQVKIVDTDNVDTGWEPYTVSCPGNRDRNVRSAFNERTYVAPREAP